MSDDPFAQPSPAEIHNPTTTKENNMTEIQTANKLTITLKGGSGFDAPWIVLHADTAAELLAQLNDPTLGELAARTQVVGQHFASQGKAAPAAAAARTGQPAGSTTPPAGAPECPPGFTYREGISKAGKAYKAFFPPRGSDEKPVFFN